MNLVVDTSVIIAVIANEPEKATLIAQTQGADLFAPLSVQWEIGNALFTLTMLISLRAPSIRSVRCSV